ncbi:hypothetical protein ASD04_10850 [Devosia sp. Root436]|nr:hypothetical protein ASD04_10850 [Devosia sp. Root436]
MGLAGLLATTTLSFGSVSAMAQDDWPSRDITIIMPYAAGGGTEPLTQAYMREMSDILGATLIIDYRPGGSGSIGTGMAIRADADGYTLGVISNGTVAMSPLTIPSLPWDGNDDYRAIVKLAEMPGILAVQGQSDFQTLEDFIDYARANAGNVHATTSGQLTPSGLTVETLNEMAGLDIVAIPTSGGGEAITQLMGGHVDANFAFGPSIRGQVASGDVRPIVSFSDTPYDFFPGVPMASDYGYDIDIGVKYYIIAPKDLPQDIADKLVAASQQAVASERFQAFLAEGGYVPPEPLTPEEIITELDGETTFYRQMLEVIGQEPLI